MNSDPFESLDTAGKQGGATDVLNALTEALRQDKQYAKLFDALLMRKRHEMGLPLEGLDSISELSEEVQFDVENYYMERCREIGGLFLEDGDIEQAWPFFRAIDEPRKVAAALDGWSPPSAEADGLAEDAVSSRIERMVEIALTEGANPRRGFELLLGLHGPDRAIEGLDQHVPGAGPVREHCARLLVDRVYADLLSALRGKVPAGDDATAPLQPLGQFVEEHPEILEQEDVPIEEDRLRATIRIAASVEDHETLQKAIEMAEYGRHFPKDYNTPGPSPFDDFYADVRIYLLALRRIGADGAVHYFRKKAEQTLPEGEGKHTPGEILVTLLARLDRYDEAVEAYFKYLADSHETASTVPKLVDLCERAGDYSKFLEQAREKNDLLEYTVGLIRQEAVSRERSERNG